MGFVQRSAAYAYADTGNDFEEEKDDETEETTENNCCAVIRGFFAENGLTKDTYEQLDRSYADTAHKIFLGAPHNDESLIRYLLPSFYRYSARSQTVNRLINYVNRHHVKRAFDEDKGWLRLADLFDAVTKSLQEDDTRQGGGLKELKKWGYYDGIPPGILAQACAQATSSLDRVVLLPSMALRRFRHEKGGKKKQPPAQKGNKPALPGDQLVWAVSELLELEGHPRDKTAGELAVLLRTVGVHPSHPFRKKLDSPVSG
ncbi:hypothetical protein BC835DRAFT_1305151 [Cytidiella melzeri]|nr:hypothetical protein BC835DRAFT_1305151 [Cytidiella melzeri]